MNSITYNGILLDGVSVRTVNRQAILNGPDYLYTAYELHVRGVYNSAYPVENPQNASPPDYDQSIRHTLLQPHKNFVFVLGGTEWVSLTQDFQNDFAYDAQLGVTPVSCNVMEVIGTKTWMVDFCFTMSLNECTGSASVLLSNRWDANQTIDGQSFSTINVAGRAVFRGDLLAKYNLKADQLRRWLLLTTPPSYKREGLSTTVSQDGLAIRYSFQDRQLAFGIPFPGIADVEIYQSMSVGHMGGERFLMEATPQYAQSTLNNADNGVKSFKNGGVSGGIGVAKASIGQAQASYQWIKDAVPKTVASVRVIVYGTYLANMAELFRAAVLIAIPRLPDKCAFMHGTSANLEANWHRKIVALTYSVDMAPLTMIAAAATTAITEKVNTRLRARSAPQKPLTRSEKVKAFFIQGVKTAVGAAIPGAALVVPLEETILPAVAELGATPEIQALNTDAIKSLEGQMATRLDPATLNVAITVGGRNELLMSADPFVYAKGLSLDSSFGSSPVSLLTAAILGACEVPEEASGLNYEPLGGAQDPHKVTPLGRVLRKRKR